MNREQKKISTDTEEKVTNHKREKFIGRYSTPVQKKNVKSTKEEMEEGKRGKDHWIV